MSSSLCTRVRLHCLCKRVRLHCLCTRVRLHRLCTRGVLARMCPQPTLATQYMLRLIRGLRMGGCARTWGEGSRHKGVSESCEMRGDQPWSLVTCT